MITRGQFEGFLINQMGTGLNGGFLGKAGFNISIADGTNASLSWIISKAIRQAGGSTANPASPTEADMATVPDANLDKMLDLSRYFAMEACCDSFDQYSVTLSMAGQQKDQIRQGMLKEVERLQKVMLDRYGYGIIDAPALVAHGEPQYPIAGQVTRDPRLVRPWGFRTDVTGV